MKKYTLTGFLVSVFVDKTAKLSLQYRMHKEYLKSYQQICFWGFNQSRMGCIHAGGLISTAGDLHSNRITLNENRHTFSVGVNMYIPYT